MICADPDETFEKLVNSTMIISLVCMAVMLSAGILTICVIECYREKA